MVPSALIFMPQLFGRVWAKEIGEDAKSLHTPYKALTLGLAASLLVALVMNVVFAGSLILAPANVGQGVVNGVMLSIFAVAASAMVVFYDNRSWKWFGLIALQQVMAHGTIGAVLAVFL